MGLTRIRAEQISDIDYKQAVRAVTVTPVTLSGGAPSQVDNVNLNAGDRILVTAQGTASQNGLYDVQTVGTGTDGTWVRTDDANATGEVSAGMVVMVTEGLAYADTMWKLITDNPIIIGSTGLTFVPNPSTSFSTISANGTAVIANASTSTLTITPSNNMVITGNNTTDTITFDINPSPSFTGTVTAGNLTVSQDATISGNLSVLGNTTFINSNVITINDKFINLANNASNASQANGGGVGVGPVGSEYASLKYISLSNSWLLTNSTEVQGYLSASGNITGDNLSGTLVTGTLTTNAQPNITSLGTLSSLSVTANVTGGNLLTGGLISATSNITGDNLFGTLVSGTLTTTAQPNVTSLGTLASLSVTANITGGNVTTGTISATGNITAPYIIGSIVGNIFGTANTVVDNAQPNITSVGTLSSLSVTGNIEAGNYLTNGLVSVFGNVTANGFSGNGASLYSLTGTAVTGTVPFANVAVTISANAQPNITSVGNLINLQFNSNTTSITAATGQLFWDTGEHTVTLGMENGVQQQIGLENYMYVKASSAITNGQAVMFTGANGTNILAAPADTTSVGFKPEYIIGVATQDIATNAFGYITVFGLVHALNTNGWNVGDILWVDNVTPGALTNTRPSDPNFQIQMAAVTKKSAGDGHIMVRPTAFYNIEQVTNVQITSPTTGQALVYDGANLLWINGTPANATYATTAGTVTTNAQPNITSVGTLTSLTVTGNTQSGNLFTTGDVSATGNMYAANFVTANTVVNNGVSTTGNVVANYIEANAGLLTGTLSLSGNIEGGNILTAGYITATGNITGSYLFGNGSQLTGIDATSIQNGTSNVRVANNANVTVGIGGTSNVGVFTTTGLSVTGEITATGNITGTNLSGSLTTADQANITSVGILSSLSVTANVTGGNLITTGTASVGGFTIGANTITSEGPTLTIDPNASGGLDGEVVIQGNLVVNGNMTYINSNNITTNDLTINMANNAATPTAANGGGIGVGPAGSEYISLNYNSASNIWVASNGLSVQGTIQAQANIAAANVVTGGLVTATGNVYGNVFIGNGAGLTNIIAANLIGAYDNANVAAYLPTYTGNLTAGNISTTGNVTTAGNVYTPTVQNGSTGMTMDAGYPGYITFFNGSGQKAILDDSGNLSVVGNVYGNVFFGNGSGLTSLVGANVTGTVANATYALSAGSAVGTAATVTTNAQPNITSVGILSSLSVSGNVTIASSAGNVISTEGNISAGYLFGNGSLLTGIITSVANINNGTSNITAYDSGNIAVSVSGVGNTVVFTPDGTTTTVDFGTDGNIYGNVYFGNGAGITGVTSIGDVGNCSVETNLDDGNVTISADGVANLATFNMGTMTMLGAYANPNYIDFSVSVIGNVNGMMVGPIAFGPTGNIQVPDGSRIVIL